MFSCQVLFQNPDGHMGFTVFGVSIMSHSKRFDEPGYFQSLSGICYDGDILVVRSRPNAPGKGKKYIYMIHLDESKQISLTKLFELPHDRDLVRDMARRLRALMALVPESPDLEAEDMVLSGRSETPPADEIPSIAERQAADAAYARARVQARETERARDIAARQAALAAERQAQQAATEPGGEVDSGTTAAIATHQTPPPRKIRRLRD